MEEVVVAQKSSSCSSSTSGHEMVSYGTFAKGEELDGDLRRGPWTVDEDLLLINYIAHHGEGRWNSLARAAGLKRTGKSCRLRWLNYLRPDVRRGNITPEEQLLILDLHSRWGNRWSKIAGELPGRTDNEIKNFWRTRVQKHARRLRCDVNSQRFRDLMGRIWMPPRLHLHRIHSSPPNYFNININNMPNYINSVYSGHQPPIPPPNPNYYPNIINNIHDQRYCYDINQYYCYYYSTNCRTIFTTTSPSSSSPNNNNNSSTSAATASADMITTVHQLDGSELLPTTTAVSFDTINANEMDQSLMWAGGGVGL